MISELLHKIVPAQRQGAKTGGSARVRCHSVESARQLFRTASSRLLCINDWGRYAGNQGAAFRLTDTEGNSISRRGPQEGDLLRINLPAPGNKAGQGFDWVRIEFIGSEGKETEDYQSLAIRVRPVAGPGGHTQTAHFYTAAATSTFSVIRQGRSVLAIELGRNEVPNTEVSWLNSLRNLFVALGARLGVAGRQWDRLMQGILQVRR